jgi:hypothetical protein
MKRTLGTAIATAALMALAGCSSSAPTDTATPAPAATTKAPVAPKAAPAAPSKPASKCVAVGTGLGKSIISGAESGTGAKFVQASAVKSPDFDKVYFIAVEFSATGVDNQVGVFASNSLKDGGGVVMAVDGLAQQFTVWPDADKTKAAISAADPSVDTAKACLA